MYRAVASTIPWLRPGLSVDLRVDDREVVISPVGVEPVRHPRSDVFLERYGPHLMLTIDGKQVRLESSSEDSPAVVQRRPGLSEGGDLPVVGVVLAATGFAGLSEQRPCLLTFRLDALLVGVPGAAESYPVHYAEVTSLKVGGRGLLAEISGGGWMGGGFGVGGMIEGAALAALMNAVTTRKTTTVETLIELVAGPRALLVFTDVETPDALRIHLAPVFEAISSSQRSSAQSAASQPAQDRLSLLKQLGELRDAGILDEDEFRAEKARILGA
jgi:hypothetical protein